MQVLSLFSEKEKAYHLYQSRQNALREETTKKNMLEQAERDITQAEQGKANAERATAQAKRETAEAMQQITEEKRQKAHLIKLLQDAGIDPKQP